MVKWFLYLLFLLSATVASAQCPPGGCRPVPVPQYRGLFRSVYAPPGSSIHVSRGGLLFRYRVYINGQTAK